MKIGVVSDTHSRGLPEQLLKDFQGVDLIIHAGDFCTMEDIGPLEKIARVVAVHGNMDERRICRKFPRSRIIDVEGRNIGIFHGEGSPNAVLESVKREFAKGEVDAAIFGHSHIAFNEKVGRILYFNPGSPNDTIFAPFCSYGLMDVTEKGIEGRIIKVRKD